jgi:hypothetical protein
MGVSEEVDLSFDLFVSYAHADRELARRLVGWLRLCGLRIWIDEEQLVPGTRFRAGLQQGIRESRHLVAVLTTEYSSRPWTQRELDLFDLSADHSDRRIIAIEIGELPAGPLDQVFLVHERVRWRGRGFDPEAFWLLHCGLTGKRPGPQAEWATKGLALVDNPGPASAVGRQGFLDTSTNSHTLGAPLNERLEDFSVEVLVSSGSAWHAAFTRLQQLVSDLDPEVRENSVANAWVHGNSLKAGLLSLATLPSLCGSYSVWPFVDLASLEIARWFLVHLWLNGFEDTEVPFSWAVAEGAWYVLPAAAKQVRQGAMRDHFHWIAEAAQRQNRPFSEIETDYDYGVMITPWNHLHLSWLALRMGSTSAAKSHAKALCEVAEHGDLRAARFLVRMMNWPCFAAFLSDTDLRARVDDAASRFWVSGVDGVHEGSNRMLRQAPRAQVLGRLEDVWKYAKTHPLTLGTTDR